MTDNELIRGIRENSNTAWRYLFRESYTPICNAVMPIIEGRRDVSFDDIFQEGCIVLMENIKDGKLTEGESNNIKGYLFTLCKRIATKKVSKAMPPAGFGIREITINGQTVKIEQSVGQEDNPDKEASEQKMIEDFLDKVLKKLSETCRKIFKRFYWDKMPMETIASTLGLKNADTAKATKTRCMKKFKEIAQDLLKDDAKAEEAIQKSVERQSLRDLFEDFLLEQKEELSVAALVVKDKGDKDKNIK
ncbi:MAG: sigma-70 family RNA polymerase sigma factor [Bacteroidales bacterium]|nr:sigma-70 family RNA polymerase sigma factor [Bacteroidales bacterium]